MIHRILLQTDCMLMATIFDDDGEILHFKIICTYHFVKLHTSLVLVAITVRFDSTSYIVDEDTGTVQPLLVLSNPSSRTETVQLINIDITANGTYSFYSLY